MRQISNEAVEGFKAFLENKKFTDNPYKTKMKYMDWCAGWRNAEKSTEEEINHFKWIYNFNTK